MKCGHPVMFATLIFSLLMMSSRVGATGYPVCDNADYGKRCQCPAGCYMVSGCDGGNPSVCKPCPEGYFQPIVGSQQSCENCSDKIPVLGACYTCKATEAPRVVPCTPTPGPPIPPTSHSSSAMPSASPSIGTSTFWTSSPTTNGSHVPSTSSSPPPMPVHDRRTVTPAVIAACCVIAVSVAVTTFLLVLCLGSRRRQRRELKTFCQKSLADFLNDCCYTPTMYWQNQTVWDLTRRRDKDGLLRKWTSLARCPVHGDGGLHQMSLYDNFEQRCSCVASSNILRQRQRASTPRYLEDLSVIEAMLLSLHLDSATPISEHPWQAIAEIYADNAISIGIIHEISLRGALPPPRSTGSATFEMLLLLAKYRRRFTVAKLGRGLIERKYPGAACCLDYDEDDTLSEPADTIDTDIGAQRTPASPPALTVPPSPPSHWYSPLKLAEVQASGESELALPNTSRTMRAALSRRLFDPFSRRFHPGHAHFRRQSSVHESNDDSGGSESNLLDFQERESPLLVVPNTHWQPFHTQDDSSLTGHSDVPPFHPSELARQRSEPQTIAAARENVRLQVHACVESYGCHNDVSIGAARTESPAAENGTQGQDSRTRERDLSNQVQPVDITANASPPALGQPEQASPAGDGDLSPRSAAARSPHRVEVSLDDISLPQPPRPGADLGYHTPPSDPAIMHAMYPVQLRPSQMLGSETLKLLQAKQNQDIPGSGSNFPGDGAPTKGMISVEVENGGNDYLSQWPQKSKVGDGNPYRPSAHTTRPPAMSAANDPYGNSPSTRRKLGEELFEKHTKQRRQIDAILHQEPLHSRGAGATPRGFSPHHSTRPSREMSSTKHSGRPRPNGVALTSSQPYASSNGHVISADLRQREPSAGTARPRPHAQSPTRTHMTQKYRRHAPRGENGGQISGKTRSSSGHDGLTSLPFRGNAPSPVGLLGGLVDQHSKHALSSKARPLPKPADSLSSQKAAAVQSAEEETAEMFSALDDRPLLDSSGNLIPNLVRRSQEDWEELERNEEIGIDDDDAFA